MKDTATKRRGLLALCAVLLTGALVLAGCGDPNSNNSDDGDEPTPANATIKLTPVEANKCTLTLTGATWKDDTEALKELEHRGGYGYKRYMQGTINVGTGTYDLDSVELTLTVTRTSDTVLTCIFSKSGETDPARTGTVQLNPKTWWEEFKNTIFEKGTEGGRFLFAFTNEGIRDDSVPDGFKGTLTVAADSGTVNINLQ